MGYVPLSWATELREVLGSLASWKGLIEKVMEYWEYLVETMNYYEDTSYTV